jgi:hypothetical protein
MDNFELISLLLNVFLLGFVFSILFNSIYDYFHGRQIPKFFEKMTKEKIDEIEKESFENDLIKINNNE